MSTDPRQFLAVLILAIVINIAAASVHAATHTSSDAVECEMCSAFFDAADAIAADDLEHGPILGQSSTESVAPAHAVHAVVISAFPRGPPVSM